MTRQIFYGNIKIEKQRAGGDIMDQKIKNLKSTTFCERRFTRQQIADIQTTIKTFPALSRREIAHTICEHLNWVTPTGTDKIQTCLNALEEMEALELIILPAKIQHKKAVQKKIQWTTQTDEPALIDTALDALFPISLQVTTEKEQANQWNEFVDRYHYLGYRRPIGSHLRYYILDKDGRKLGCLLFSFATLSLPCRDMWIGWNVEQRKKHLNLVVNNNRFLIFPWIKVKHLASKALALAMNKIADDWEKYHGFRPVLLETFVDPEKYKGTCYKAANWQYIGKTVGKSLKNNPDQKDIYIHPLMPDAREALTDKKKSPSKKAQPFKSANLAADSDISLWQKIIIVVSAVSDEFDKKWQKRRRVIDTLLIVLFIFRLVFSKNKQGYGTTIAELWDYCHKMNINLPQKKPVVAAAFGNARAKLDENFFKILNTEVIRTYESDQDDFRWKNHRLFAVDGTKINLPKQLQNFAYKTPSDNAYYPQGLVSCLYQLKVKIPVDFDLSSHLDERKMAYDHLSILNKNDVVVYDRGYFSYAMLYFHHIKGIHAVFRLASSSYKVIDEFMQSADKERIVIIITSLKRQKKTFLKYPEIELKPLSLRLIKYDINGITYTLGTTLLDSQQYMADEFADIYHSRWGIEELYKISKSLIDVEDFHGQTERGVKQELFAHFVLITFARIFTNKTDDILMLNKNSDAVEKTKCNFKNCLVTIARNLEALFLQQVQRVKETITTIVNLVSTCRQKERLDRSYKRQSNKPIKKWKPGKEKRAKHDIAAVAA